MRMQARPVSWRRFSSAEHGTAYGCALMHVALQGPLLGLDSKVKDFTIMQSSTQTLLHQALCIRVYVKGNTYEYCA